MYWIDTEQQYQVDHIRSDSKRFLIQSIYIFYAVGICFVFACDLKVSIRTRILQDTAIEVVGMAGVVFFFFFYFLAELELVVRYESHGTKKDHVL